MRCFKLLGERVKSHECERQVAELQIRVAIVKVSVGPDWGYRAFHGKSSLIPWNAKQLPSGQTLPHLAGHRSKLRSRLA